LRFAFGLPLLAALLATLGCSHGGSSGSSVPSVKTASARQQHVEGAPREELHWETFSAETFARAKAERKFVVMDGAAEWCHWCHVMEATTYHDAGVRAVLDKHFISVKVDVDSRPDLAERYGDYGWPATIIFSPDATELGKYRGYIAPEKFSEILKEVVASGAATLEAGADPGKTAGYVIGASRGVLPRTPLPEEQLLWIQRATDVELDDYWDAEQGGWGRTQKAPLGMNNAWLLSRAKDNASAKTKVLFALDQQAKLIDPVWGGIYQYSAASDWDHAHFEKLMTFQAPALENYAYAYRLTGDEKHLVRAKLMLAYLDRFMKGPEGGFYTTQDADVNAHDRTKPYMNGHEYYTTLKTDAERRARGIPRIDTNEYGRENGLAIAAYAAMYEVTKDPAVLASAEKAARRILTTHAVPKRGGAGISHAMKKGAAEEDAKVLYLSDNAAFGYALMRLYEVTKNDEWDRAAKKIADFMLSDLIDEDSGGLYGNTKDPDAVGIFAKRRIPFEDNVMALRLFARLAKTSTEPAYRIAIDRILRAISTPEEIKARGRMLGDYLLALEETKDVRNHAPKK